MEFTRQTLSLVTVMFWSRLSDHIGRKPILQPIYFHRAQQQCWFVLSFLPELSIWIGMIGEITNESNSADAFALLHVPWASGYAVGALVGGWLASPQSHFPSWFHGQIWTNHPYLLPCLTVACFPLVGCLIIVLYLKETVPTFVRGKFHGRPYEDGASQPLSSECDRPPLASLLTPPILLACTNYCILGGLHASSNTLQPLFLAMPVAVGGLGLSSRSISYILAVYELINAFVQTFLLGRLVRQHGAGAVFVSAMVTILPVFFLPPAMNWCLRTYGWKNVVELAC